jgi:hypothetical protein
MRDRRPWCGRTDDLVGVRLMWPRDSEHRLSAGTVGRRVGGGDQNGLVGIRPGGRSSSVSPLQHGRVGVAGCFRQTAVSPIRSVSQHDRRRLVAANR